MTLSVLVADDSKLARKLLINALPPEWDVQVSEACNGAEAIAAHAEGRASVMFLDLTMPVMTGFEVLEELQRQNSKSIVIVVSADVQTGAKERVKSTGAAAFVEKPVTHEKLAPVLREIGLHA